MEGTHIKIKRVVKTMYGYVAYPYYHHAITVSEDEEVVHFSGPAECETRDCSIIRSHMEDFTKGPEIPEEVSYQERDFIYGRGQPIADRALDKIGKHDPYSLLGNNCEHFATWCVTGKHRSRQVLSALYGAPLMGALIETLNPITGLFRGTPSENPHPERKILKGKRRHQKETKADEKTAPVIPAEESTCEKILEYSKGTYRSIKSWFS